MNEEQTKPITPKRSAMMHQIMDGQSGLAMPLYQIYQHVACDLILAWLISNNLTGEKFRLWLQNEHANSSVLMMSHIVKKLRRDLKNQPIIVGKDWFPAQG